MQYVKLPGTELIVSRIAFGCMSLVPNDTYKGVSADEATRAVEVALDSGINFFDTAPAYGKGRCEELLGQALRGRREQAIIADKASGKTLTEQEIIEDCEASLKRLQTDVIDLYQIHWPRHVTPMEETAEAMRKLLMAGKVRSLGVCNFGPQDLSEFLDITPCATNQIVYSLLARGAEHELRDLCLEHEVGLLCYSPLAQGLLTGRYRSADEVPEGRARTRHFSSSRPKARHDGPGCEAETFQAIARVREICQRLDRPMPQVALAWLLAQPGVTAVLAGGSRAEQIQANAAVADLELTPDVLAELDDVTLPVKEKMGSNLDMWAPASRVV